MTERKAPARNPRKAAPRKATAPEPTVEEQIPPGAPPHPTGFVGDLPDETPNDHYTLSGVISGKPIPGHGR